ncbi:MAG: hypothetical protein K2J88_01170 [Oscillospiraceae bacterium]|nr:hypothetical protein [Oscillospiraceae bacterium]
MIIILTYGVIKKYKKSNAYNLLFLEQELNHMHDNGYELKKIDDKNRFYFKQQLPKKNINYFILIPEFAYESKLWFDRSKKLIIELKPIEKYLIENL